MPLTARPSISLKFTDTGSLSTMSTKFTQYDIDSPITECFDDTHDSDYDKQTETLLPQHDRSLHRQHLRSSQRFSYVKRWYRVGRYTLGQVFRFPNRLVSRPQLKSIRKNTSRSSLWIFFACVLGILVACGVVFPSYTRLPPHYSDLQSRISDGFEQGSANQHQEKVFIAASIFDPGGKLADGEWAQRAIDLIHILGPDNVYLSIYGNDAGSEAERAMEQLKTRVPCNNSLVFDSHLDLQVLPHVILPDGTQRIKRIAYLAEVRNRALQPLASAEIRFDKVLYLNDVIFDPIDAAHLLFSTNIDEDGRAQYRSACAVDFINPFKFYDTFATRDLDGFSIGLPFFPWVTPAGSARTWMDILSGKDAVRVKSCWGGMVAFNATFFQNWQNEAAGIKTASSESPSNLTAPYAFRVEEDIWWDSSECCLIQADIQDSNQANTGIFMNPYIRVAYDSYTLGWLRLTRRFERLYTPIHVLGSFLAGLPIHNPRRNALPWEETKDIVWAQDATTLQNGSWREVTRIAKHDGFCGSRHLPVLRENAEPGERNWEFIEIPAGGFA